jgi:ATP synthase protein I
VKEEDKKLIKQVFHVSSIGFSLVFAIVIGLVIGIFLDKKFGTAPWLTLIFLVFGIIAGFRNIFYIFKKYGLDYEDKDEKGDNEDT